jgi:hypothetical protein
MATDLYTPKTLPTVLPSFIGGPVYTKNGLTVRELTSREGTETAGGTSAAITWLVSGSSDPIACRDALRALGLDPLVTVKTIDNVYDRNGLSLGLRSLSRERVADDAWEFTAEYSQREPEPGQFTVSIDTSGGQILQTYAYTETRFNASGETLPNMGGAIDVQDDTPQGVQRVIPALKVSIRAKIKAANVNSVGGVLAYSQIISELTGTVNNAPSLVQGPPINFPGFEAGEMLFTGATGDIVAEDPTLTFNFIVSKNVLSLNIGNITGITKAGHDYIWFGFKNSKDSGTGLKRREIRGAYVNRIYNEANHGLLYIGV